MPDEREAGPTLRALGLCAKAGRLVCGTALICEALRGRNRPLLVLEDSVLVGFREDAWNKVLGQNVT